MDRRTFLSRLLSAPLAAAFGRAAQAAPPLRITGLETVYWKTRDDAPFWPHWTWLRIHTDGGVFGIGETYPRNTNEAAAIHGVASTLIGKAMTQWLQARAKSAPQLHAQLDQKSQGSSK